MTVQTFATRALLGALLSASMTACLTGEGDSDDSSGESADAVTASKIQTLALANVGKKACSTNSLGGHAYETSCDGNGGSPEYWCADFAKWVWAHAGVQDLTGLDPAAASFYDYGVKHGTFSHKPHVGAAAVFEFAPGDGVHHVAIVTKVESNGYIETVSGDWDGESGTEAHFASTSHVIHNTLAYSSVTGYYRRTMGQYIVGYVLPPALKSDVADSPDGPGLSIDNGELQISVEQYADEDATGLPDHDNDSNR